MQRSGKDSTLVKLLPPGVYQVGPADEYVQLLRTMRGIACLQQRGCTVLAAAVVLGAPGCRAAAAPAAGCSAWLGSA